MAKSKQTFRDDCERWTNEVEQAAETLDKLQTEMSRRLSRLNTAHVAACIAQDLLDKASGVLDAVSNLLGWEAETEKR